jgi:hypothetical protein
MLNDSIGNKNREFAEPHQGGEQERVLGAYRDRIEEISVFGDFRSSDGETGGIEVTDPAVGLE